MSLVLSRKASIAFVILFFLITSTTSLPMGRAIPRPGAQVVPILPTFIQLGYSPTSLSPLQYGIPVYSTGDSIWILSNSSILTSVQLVAPNGDVVASRAISPFAAFLLYTYSSSDSEGNWILRVILRNSTVIPIAIQYVNPASHEVSAKLLNFSMKSGELGVEFALRLGQAFNIQACLASSDVNSSVIISTPIGVGTGPLILKSNMKNANLSASGSLTNPFSFWFDLVYPYSYAGGVSGELISKEIVSISSTTAYFSSNIGSATVSLSNKTNPRPGVYKLDAYFESSNGLTVEQTTVLVMRNGDFVWMGGCNPLPVSSSVFYQQESFLQPPQAWPRTLYLSYDIGGVYSYSASSISLNESRIDIVSSMALSSSNTPPPVNQIGNLFSYLNFSIVPNPNVLSYEFYNDSIFMMGSSFPMLVQIDPTFGNQRLQPLLVRIVQPLTATQVSIQVGGLAVQITNNSSPLSGANVTVENHYGGTITATSDSAGVADFYLPAGSYNVTVAGQGYSDTKAATLEANAQSNIQFVFSSPSSPDLTIYLLVSLAIVGLVLNILLWMIRSRRDSSGSVSSSGETLGIMFKE